MTNCDMNTNEAPRGATILQFPLPQRDAATAPDPEGVTRQVHTLLKLMIELIGLLERELGDVALARFKPADLNNLADDGAALAAISSAMEGLARVRSQFVEIDPGEAEGCFPGEGTIEVLGEVLRNLSEAAITVDPAPQPENAGR